MRRRTQRKPASAVVRALTRHFNVSDSADGMRLLVSDLLSRSSETMPPFNLDLLARLAGATSVEVSELDVDGDLVERAGDLVVRVNASAPLGRRRFTTAHEIAHLLLLTLIDVPTRRMVCGEDRHLERLCDVGATELLMPARFVRQFFDENPQHVESIIKLARQFEVSLHAAGLRVIELIPWCRGLALMQRAPDGNGFDCMWSAGLDRDAFAGPEVLSIALESQRVGETISRDIFVGAGGRARRSILEIAPFGQSPIILALVRSPRLA
jgi:hypothetical protein